MVSSGRYEENAHDSEVFPSPYDDIFIPSRNEILLMIPRLIKHKLRHLALQPLACKILKYAGKGTFLRELRNFHLRFKLINNFRKG